MRFLERRYFASLMLGLAGTLGCVAHAAHAGDHCFYRGTMYSDGAAACQAGTQSRCEDGEWRSLGVACSDRVSAPSRTCDWDGISFSSGSASCQAGTQYRCEDGSWRSLSSPCQGAKLVKADRNGRTCMFDDVTVSSDSTICKSGSTMLCNDGEWVNVGTSCR